MDRLANTRYAALDGSLARLGQPLRCANIVLEGGDPDIARLDTIRNLNLLITFLYDCLEVKALCLVAC